MAELLDCREVLLPAFETTKTDILERIISQQATHCFHDGHLLEDGKFLKFEKLVFCSFSCALAHFPPEIHPRLHMTFPGMVYDIAPPRRYLHSFGGHLSLSQFRAHIDMPVNPGTREPRCLYDNGDINSNEIVYLDGSFFCSNKCKLAYLGICLPGSKLETNIRSQSAFQEFPAPDRILLNIFGGPMTLEDFRTASYTLVLPPQYLTTTSTEMYSHYLVMRFDGNSKKPVVPRKQAYFPTARPKTNLKSKKPLTVLNNLPFQRK